MIKKKGSKSATPPSVEEIIEALQTPSKGRLKVIQSAHEAVAFVDKRLAEVALRAIDDSNAKIADYVATTILPTLGSKNHKWLLRTANPKNPQGYVRRITLMHKIDPLATQSLVRALAKEAKSPVIKALAIDCLSASPDNFSLLVELHDSKDSCFWFLGRRCDHCYRQRARTARRSRGQHGRL